MTEPSSTRVGPESGPQRNEKAPRMKAPTERFTAVLEISGLDLPKYFNDRATFPDAANWLRMVLA